MPLTANVKRPTIEILGEERAPEEVDIVVSEENITVSIEEAAKEAGFEEGNVPTEAIYYQTPQVEEGVEEPQTMAMAAHAAAQDLKASLKAVLIASDYEDIPVRTCFKYTLSDEDLQLMKQHAQARLDLAKAENRVDYLGSDDITSHFKGVCGEYVVTRWLDVPYEFTNGTYRTKPDIYYKGHKLEVRCGRELKVKRTDNNDQIVVNVIQKSETEYEVSGWVYAHEGKKNKYEDDPGRRGRPAYFLPKGDTRTLESFLALFPAESESVFAETPTPHPKKVVETVAAEIPSDGQPTYELIDLDEGTGLRLRVMLGKGTETVRVLYRGKVAYFRDKALTHIPEEFVKKVHGG